MFKGPGQKQLCQHSVEDIQIVSHLFSVYAPHGNGLGSLFWTVVRDNVDLQAVTKYIVGAKADALATQGLSQEEINIRDAFVASPGCVLIGADYSQVELRVLAHLSGDPHLIHILTQAGLQGDAFALIAKTWLRPSHQPGDDAAVTAKHLFV